MLLRVSKIVFYFLCMFKKFVISNDGFLMSFTDERSNSFFLSLMGVFWSSLQLLYIHFTFLFWFFVVRSRRKWLKWQTTVFLPVVYTALYRRLKQCVTTKSGSGVITTGHVIKSLKLVKIDGFRRFSQIHCKNFLDFS